MKILLTGNAGFIGFHIAKCLAEAAYELITIDSINDYYDVALKSARLTELGIIPDIPEPEKTVTSTRYPSLQFRKISMSDMDSLRQIFDEEKPEIICHIAAKPGVRCSIEHSELYLQNNVVAFFNLLCCRHHAVQHLIYASSSCVYGANAQVPFSPEQHTDAQASIYAATPKNDEIFAAAYSWLYQIPTTALRFFTVYGPWGRPDMAPFKFTRAILERKPLDLYNNGNQERDFTYIDDIVFGVVKVIEKGFLFRENGNFQNIYNIRGSHPVKLMDFIDIQEKTIGKKAKIHPMPMQSGDVQRTWADTEPLKRDYGASPKISVEEGIPRFIQWYGSYYANGK